MRGGEVKVQRATEGEACLDAGQSARASLPVPATACFDRLLLPLGTICRCQSRSEARSCPRNRRESGECRLNALAFDSGPPLVCDEPAATYERASDEHGRLIVSAATNRLGLGDKIRLIPGHCDATVNLYDWYVCVRGNRVEQLWPITARGAVY
jgi:D-serine deaminase-like pyridoxal phosphate-dependent protein